ncbi:MAG: hypothetical protein VYE22_30750 [Myxococcota bacterium]|nr:hypothetical protein [Myxococcota bacterium]
MSDAPERSERLLEPVPAVRSAVAYLCAVEHHLARGAEEGSEVLPDHERTLALDAIAACEAAVGARLTDEVLALFASGASALSSRKQMKLSLVGALTEQAHDEGLRRNLVAFGRDGHLWYAIPKSPDDEDRRRVFVYDDRDGSHARWDLVRILTQEAEALLDDVELDQTVENTLSGEANAQRFVVRLVSAQAEGDGDAQAQRRVQHAKFGGGTVLREIHDGPEPKLEIAFDAAGTKTLLARFVQEA